MKRSIDILVLSDLHLGTFGAQAHKLLAYLDSIDPEMVVLNGDIVDIWLFDRDKFPKTHLKVLKYFINYVKEGKVVYYLPGNHDDDLRRFSGFVFENFHLKDEIVLNLKGKKTWFFHGDKFDKSVSGAMRGLAVMGGKAYDRLVKTNRDLNKWLDFLGMERTHFSRSLKSKTKKKVSEKVDFEQMSVDHAIENGYDVMVCGHVHKPGVWERKASKGKQKITYHNSGDWVESCTALEYNKGKWTLYTHPADEPAYYKTFLRDFKLSEEIDVSPTMHLE